MFNLLQNELKCLHTRRYCTNIITKLSENLGDDYSGLFGSLKRRQSEVVGQEKALRSSAAEPINIVQKNSKCVQERITGF